jgi:hypothetical protein
MRRTRRLPLPLPLCLSLIAPLALGGCGGGDPASPRALGPAAEVSFAFTGRPADTLRVLVRGEGAIADVRAFLATRDGPRIPAGTIARGAGLDPRYPFHFLPESVQLVDAAIELCDGAPMRTAGAVDEYMRGATGEANPQQAPWCPWSAYPVSLTVVAED